MKRSIGFVSVLMFLISACATTTVVVVEKKPEPEAEAPTIEAIRGYTPTESEVKSLEIFKEIYKLAVSSDDKRSYLPRIEELYTRIITDYPDAPLAKESY
jgi:hypothetical protein